MELRELIGELNSLTGKGTSDRTLREWNDTDSGIVKRERRYLKNTFFRLVLNADDLKNSPTLLMQK